MKKGMHMNPSDAKKQNNPGSGDINYGNLAVKILCVLAAFVLWIYVMAVESPAYEQTISDVTVRFENEDVLREKNLSVYSGYSQSIEVTLSGKKSRLSKITGEDITAYIDLSETDVTGRRDCIVNVDVPDGCKLTGISRDTISVYIDESAKKSVEIEHKTVNFNSGAGYEVGEYDLNVDIIDVRGAAKYVETVAYAKVEFDLSGVSKTKEVTGDVKLYNEYGNEVSGTYLEYSPARITVDIPIIKIVEEPIQVKFKHGFLNSETADITLSVHTITVSGDPLIVNKGNYFSPIVIDEKLDFDENGVCVKTVKLTPPDGLNFSEETVTVTVTRNSNIGTRRLTVLGKNIVESGASNKLNYEVNRSNVEVVVMGPRDKLTEIDPYDVTLWLDISPYDAVEPGVEKVPAKVLIDSAFSKEVLEIGTYYVEVIFYD